MDIVQGLDVKQSIGPLISAEAREKVHEQVNEAVARGAELLAGGKPMEGPGFYFEPTVLMVRCGKDVRFDEEIFGPVCPIISCRGRGGGPEAGKRFLLWLGGNSMVAGPIQGTRYRLATGGRDGLDKRMLPDLQLRRIFPGMEIERTCQRSGPIDDVPEKEGDNPQQVLSS